MQEKLEKSGPRLKTTKKWKLTPKGFKIVTNLNPPFSFYENITNARGDIPTNFINMYIAVWRMWE